MAYADRTVVSKSGETLYHYKWADPQFLDLSIGMAVTPKSIMYSLQNMLCHEQSRTPLLAKKELTSMHLLSLSSTVTGSGDIFYTPIQDSLNTVDQKEVVLVFKMHEDIKIAIPPTISIPRSRVDNA
jgi:hypothetical protein